ncbi:MAG: hypothetical protein SGPRY_007843 [Prymnesium sp.]
MADRPRRQPSCLAIGLSSGVEGGLFGCAIGGIMASGAAFQLGFLNGGLRLIVGNGLVTALQVGGFLAAYSGGVCALERARKQQDVFNPALVGGLMGMAGAVSPHGSCWRATRNSECVLMLRRHLPTLCRIAELHGPTATRDLSSAVRGAQLPEENGSAPNVAVSPVPDMPSLNIPRGISAKAEEPIDNGTEATEFDSPPSQQGNFAGFQQSSDPSESPKRGEDLQDPWAGK